MKRSTVLGLVACVVVALLFLAGCQTVTLVPQAKSAPPPPPQPDRSKIKELPLPPLQLDRLTEDEKNTVTLYRSLNRGVVNVTSIGTTYTWLSQSYPTGGTGSGSIKPKG